MNREQVARVITLKRRQLFQGLRSQGIPYEDAEDALQDACLRALGATAGGHTLHDAQLAAWLSTTARRCHLDGRDQSAELRAIPTGEFVTAWRAQSPDFAASLATKSSLLYSWQHLRKWEQEALKLHVAGMTCQDISEQLGISLDAAKKRLLHARNRLASILRLNGIDVEAGERRRLPRNSLRTRL